MNAAVRAVVRTATPLGIEVLAYLDGYTGLVEGRTRLLTDRTVGSQVQRGGTFIGTSRCPRFRSEEGRKRAAEQLMLDGVEALVVVGGDGSFRGALALQEECGTLVAGLPGTIDNDVYGTDETIGFDTAVNTAVEAMDRIRDTSEATGMMFFVEVMGRSAGAIAIHTALAGGAAGVVVPEEHGEIERLIERLRVSHERGKRSHIVICAEGDDEGGAFAIGKRVGEALDHEYRVVVLGHIQRGGRPTARDRVIASLMGARAVEALAAGRTGMMIGMWRGEVVEVPLTEVVEKVHGVPRLEYLHLAQALSG
jgi:6-phosphofructokinase 1